MIPQSGSRFSDKIVRKKMANSQNHTRTPAVM